MGGVQVNVALPLATARTLITNDASETLAVPSDTEITMAAELPTSPAVGVPVRRPLVVLNVAQAGLLSMRQVSEWPSGSDAVGRKLYGAPTVALVAGDPPMVGERFAGVVTWIMNDCSATD